MPAVTYIEHDGSRHRVDVDVGDSLMEGALRNGVPGIEADCGGALACATCHIYVPPAWSAETGVPSADELDMLECANDVDARSRLSCQIRMTPALDGIEVELPASQR